jgi:DNA-binding FadR family transcriptional regulator
MEFRRMYGREIARLAATRATEEDLIRLSSIADSCDDPTLGPDELLARDFEFYVALTQTARNRVLTLLINTTRPAVLAYSSFFTGLMKDGPAVRRHQRDLIEAIRRHETDAAAQLADTYLA